MQEILIKPELISCVEHDRILRIAAYGKITADSVLDKGLALHLMAPLGNAPTIMVALDNYLKEANK